MEALLSQALVVFGALIALATTVVKWRDNRDARRSLLAAQTEEIRAKLGSIPPLSGWLVFVATGLAALSLAIGLDLRAASLVAKAAGARECSSDAQCEVGQYCSGGSCVANARKPAPPRKDSGKLAGGCPPVSKLDPHRVDYRQTAEWYTNQ